MARAVLAGGCFWCLEAVFLQIEGIERVVPGYTGGTSENPSYEAVCTGRTGHAEVVAIDYDPQKISYEQLLEIFFTIHDPTTLNRQGADVGTQYRSAIFVDNDADREAAEKAINQLAEEYMVPVVTAIEPLTVFHPAEEYHNRYFERHPEQGYCSVVVRPKVQKARVRFIDWLKPAYR